MRRMSNVPIETAIDLVGLQPLAKRLGVTYQAIRKWCATDVPPERVIAVCEATDWRVTPHLLRPDIYPNPSDAIPVRGMRKDRGVDRRHAERRKEAV